MKFGWGIRTIATNVLINKPRVGAKANSCTADAKLKKGSIWAKSTENTYCRPYFLPKHAWISFFQPWFQQHSFRTVIHVLGTSLCVPRNNQSLSIKPSVRAIITNCTSSVSPPKNPPAARVGDRASLSADLGKIWISGRHYLATSRGGHQGYLPFLAMHPLSVSAQSKPYPTAGVQQRVFKIDSKAPNSQ
jgi:hypothetical protein